MIGRERNTYDLYLRLIRRLFAAAGKLRPVDACSVGMAWQRWAARVGLWGTPKFHERAASARMAKTLTVSQPGDWRRKAK